MSLKIHLVYCFLITTLLVIIASLSLNRFFEKEVVIPSMDNKTEYKLRMLASGDLIFEKDKFLPLGSYRDYWGDMDVNKVEWIDDSQLIIVMKGGSRIKIRLGSIEVQFPDKSDSVSN